MYTLQPISFFFNSTCCMNLCAATFDHIQHPSVNVATDAHLHETRKQENLRNTTQKNGNVDIYIYIYIYIYKSKSKDKIIIKKYKPKIIRQSINQYFL